MPQQIILRKGTAAEWTAAGSVVLAAGEPGFETNTGKFKIGNGVTAWNSLSYAVGTIPVNLADLADVTSDTPTSGQVLKWNGTAWAPAADSTGGGTGATYAISTELASGGANLRLTGSDASTDDVKFESGSGITITRPDGNTITISNDNPVDTNTLYNISSETATGGAFLRLSGDDASTDDVKFASGTDITVESTGAGVITINSTAGRVESGLGLDLAFYETPGTTVKGSNGFLTYDADGSSLYVEGRVNYKLLGVGKGSVTPNTSGITVSAAAQLDLVGPSTRISAASISIGGQIGQGRSALAVIDNGAPVPGGAQVLTLRTYSPTAGNLPSLSLQRISSVDGTPTAMVSGDNIYAIKWTGFDGNAPTSTITNISRTSGILTVTTSSSHGMPTTSYGPTGWAVTIICTTDTSINLNNISVLTAASSTSFTVPSPGPDIASIAADGTVTAYNFDVKIAQIKAEVSGTVGTGVIPGVLKLQVANSSGVMQEALRLSPDRTATFNNTVAINGTSSGLRIGSTGGTGGGLITAVGTTINLPAGSTVNGALIGSITIKGTVADNTALLALTGMTLGDAYVVLSPTPTHLWSYSGSAWVDLGVFQGPAGADGSPGQGVPTGGTAGQLLSKIDGTNYNTEWTSLAAVATSGEYGDLTGTPTLPNSFGTIAISGQSDVVADSTTDTLTLVAGSGITLTSNASTDTITIANSASATNSFTTVSVSGQSDVVADSATDTLTLIAGTGITLTTNATNDSITITNSVADTDTNTTYSIKATTTTGGATLDLDAGGSGSGTDSVTFAGGTGITVSRTDANTITVASSVTDTNTTYSINAVDGTTGKKIIRLTAGGSGSGDDDVVLVAGTNVTLDRTGDEITINSTASGGGGGVGLGSRADVTGTTGSIADGATGNIAITGYKAYALLKIVVEHQAWVRIYTDTASRTADASRAEGVDPTPGSGVIAEVITTSAPQTILISPGTIGFNNEGTPTTSIPIAVTNKSGTTRTITVTLTVLQLEA